MIIFPIEYSRSQDCSQLVSSKGKNYSHCFGTGKDNFQLMLNSQGPIFVAVLIGYAVTPYYINSSDRYIGVCTILEFSPITVYVYGSNCFYDICSSYLSVLQVVLSQLEALVVQKGTSNHPSQLFCSCRES